MTTKETKSQTGVMVAGAEKLSGQNILLIKRPRLTEKSGLKAEKDNVYTFEIAVKATKDKVRRAIFELYKVKPTKVNIVNLPAKKVFSRGKKGSVSGVKKAIVFLKAGDKIEFI